MPQSPQLLAQELAEHKRQIVADYRRHRSPQRFFAAYSALLAHTVTALWQQMQPEGELALLALGGFGRGEMYPHSDVDLGIVAADALNETQQQQIETWLQTLWDMGLNPSLKTGSVAELCAGAAEDLTGDTSLLEARLLHGSRELFARLRRDLDVQRDLTAFAEGKLLELQQRHLKAQAGSSLEPNLKTCPGGLRDIHTMLWLARVQGISPQLHRLARQGILTRTEAAMLRRSHRSLARIRIELHLAAGKPQEQLRFDLQPQVAYALGYTDESKQVRSERLMHTLYRAVKTVKQLGGILLPMLRGRISSPLPRVALDLDEHYFQVNNLIAVRDKTLFRREPQHIFKVLERWQQYSDLSGLAPETLRAWWQAVQKTDARFYADPANRRRFVGFFRHGGGLTHLLRFLNLYGALSHYLPEWGKIVGLLQHDLFHVYPVDDHILMVVRNMRRLALEAHSHELPFASALMHAFERKPVLYLAALFHDIAKGRGGDHSKLGERDVLRFCRTHGITGDDQRLLGFLVREHLTMSMTAQKRDLADPEVIAEFAQRVQTPRRLTALYLLTVADIRGTSARVWNAWKGKLLEDLYRATLAYLSGHTARPATQMDARRQAAAGLLRERGIPDDAYQAFWNTLDIGYFLRHDPQDLAWHTEMLHAHADERRTSVHTRASGVGDGIEFLIFTMDKPALFARICRFFDQQRLSILEARVHTTRHGMALDSFEVMTTDQRRLPPEQLTRLEAELARLLDAPLDPGQLKPAGPSRLSRRSRAFPLPPRIDLRPDEAGQRYLLSITATDRPGLLYDLARILANNAVELFGARIATLGERAEDSFTIGSDNLHTEAERLKLEKELLEIL